MPRRPRPTEALLASRSELGRRDSSATETPAYVLPDEPEVVGTGEESVSSVELGVAWRSVGLGSGWKEKWPCTSLPPPPGPRGLDSSLGLRMIDEADESTWASS